MGWSAVMGWSAGRVQVGTRPREGQGMKGKATPAGGRQRGGGRRRDGAGRQGTGGWPHQHPGSGAERAEGGASARARGAQGPRGPGRGGAAGGSRGREDRTATGGAEGPTADGEAPGRTRRRRRGQGGAAGGPRPPTLPGPETVSGGRAGRSGARLAQPASAAALAGHAASAPASPALAGPRRDPGGGQRRGRRRVPPSLPGQAQPGRAGPLARRLGLPHGAMRLGPGGAARGRRTGGRRAGGGTGRPAAGGLSGTGPSRPYPGSHRGRVTGAPRGSPGAASAARPLRRRHVAPPARGIGWRWWRGGFAGSAVGRWEARGTRGEEPRKAGRRRRTPCGGRSGRVGGRRGACRADPASAGRAGTCSPTSPRPASLQPGLRSEHRPRRRPDSAVA
ncbi:collagen alpha-2(I) chain-like [Pipistrellus kuhlii]|uniref:collagen alpha-2(I) chain-like n=1 Tax=Pipistrellus kuhlii TaxID=59472 RepID=UPI001E27362F|nr:collagen alpha-2(I) chain-like [Pipistrellus kuhlii]